MDRFARNASLNDEYLTCKHAISRKKAKNDTFGGLIGFIPEILELIHVYRLHCPQQGDIRIKSEKVYSASTKIVATSPTLSEFRIEWSVLWRTVLRRMRKSPNPETAFPTFVMEFRFRPP